MTGPAPDGPAPDGPSGSVAGRLIVTRDGRVAWQQPLDHRDPGAVPHRSEGITGDPAVAARARAVLDGGARLRAAPGGGCYWVNVYGPRPGGPR